MVGVNKPAGISSHDVVNSCRAVFNERRVGHTGTLDPMATGVLPVCVGPATRLDAFLSGHDKWYCATVVFGVGTDTDDATGREISTSPVPKCAMDENFASSLLAGMVGAHEQVPPAYSAVKVEGVRSYEAARKGENVRLLPRAIEVYGATLLAVRELAERGLIAWDVEFHVSAGTYIRALARDIGEALQCPAHVGALERFALGALTLDECVTLETLAKLKERAAIDPVRLLGLRIGYVDEALASKVRNGASFCAENMPLYEMNEASADSMNVCTSEIHSCTQGPHDGEMVAIVADNKLVALYEYVGERDEYKARCVFQTGVYRGGNL